MRIPNQEEVENLVLKTIGKGFKREELLDTLCPDEESEIRPLLVNSILDDLIEKGVLVEALTGLGKGWIVQVSRSPSAAARISSQNEKALEERLDWEDESRDGAIFNREPSW